MQTKKASSFEILPASWHDLGDLRRLEQECFKEDAWPLWDLIGVLTFPGVIRLKAVVGNDMAGFVSGDPRQSEGMGWITTIGVRPVYRRRGIATALLLEAERQMGMERVRLSVRRSNIEAIHLYEQYGYRQVSVWAKYYAGGEDGLIFEKHVNLKES